MITTIVNGIMVDAESIVAVHLVEVRYNRYETRHEESKPFSQIRRSHKEDDTLSDIMREVYNEIKKRK